MKKTVRSIWVALVAMSALAVCAQANGSQAAGSKPDVGAASDAATYVIGPTDVLDVNVWKEPDVSRTVPVRPDGKISLPLLNDVQAAGLTPMELQAEVTKDLKGFISNPQVTIIVTQINSRRVYVLGEVAHPGAFAMLPHMTVLQALSSAGGLGQFAKSSGIYVLRGENGRQVTFPFNYKEVVRGKRADQNITLQPGDTIVVP
jgi:polysaccharide biosynthesis/export protein